MKTKSAPWQPFSIFKIIDKVVIIEGEHYKLCDSFLPLCHYLGAYLHSKSQYPELISKIDEKICELVGFYIWYNKKITLANGPNKTISSLCMGVSLCRMLLKIMEILGITNIPKKVDKVLTDLATIKAEMEKELGLLPIYHLEEQISSLY